VFVPADVVFLSLDADTAAAWFDQARAVAYRPSRGVAGVYSLFDARLRAALEEFGARVLSPYLVPLNAETRSKAFRSIDEPLGMGVIHGWVTAKDLAVAIWLHDVDGPRSMRAALRALEGYASGFAPPLDWRVGTHARTPEGLVYEVDDGLFTPMTGFLRDPF
jgi:hypothetical protein